jgi:hypothetical protein
MSQPDWECIAQLGDTDPIEHGGYWILRDKNGIYPEEGELLIAPEDEGGEYIIHRFTLNRCTFIDGILSDNEFHPDHSAWWAGTEEERKARPQDSTYLKNIADFIGMDVEELAADFCSENALVRARAYQAVGDYHGFDNLDNYPLTMTRREVKKRYKELRFKTPA